MRELERFLDDAVLAGLDNIRIVHGKGEGVMRKATHEFLRRYAPVVGFGTESRRREARGVTIAYLA